MLLRPRSALELPGAFEHGGDGVEAGDAAYAIGEEARDDAGTAGDVKDGIFGARFGALRHQFEQCVPAAGVAAQERLSLLRKLALNFEIVLNSVHGGS